MIANFFAAVGLVIGLAGGAQANIVTNGSFETGDFTGWQQTGDSSFNEVICPGGAPQGSCYAIFGPFGDLGGIQQTLPVDNGLNYVVSFAFEADGGVTSDFIATFDGVTLLNLVNPPASGFVTYTFAITTKPGSASNSVLSFQFRDDPGFLSLDAVSVAVPEPMSLALVGIALGGLGFVRRKA